MSKTISNQRSSNLVNGNDLSTTITNLQTSTSNLTSNLTTINNVLNADTSAISTLSSQLVGFASLGGSNNFTNVNSFSSLPTSSAVPSNNSDLVNKLYCDNQNALQVNLTGDQSISGIKSFLNPPMLSGASISSQSIQDSSLSSNVMLKSSANNVVQNNVTNGYCDLSSAQTIGGIKTFSSIPVLPNNAITQTKVTNGYADLTSAQTIAGIKTFSSIPVLPANTIAQTNVTNGYCDLTSAQTIGGVKSFSSNPQTSSVASVNNDIPNKLYIDTADNLKANLSNPTFVGTVTTANLTATGTVTLPTSSIADTALSSNIAKLNGTNTFSNVVKCTTLPVANNDLANKLYVDNADNLKANIAGPTFTGTVTIPTLNVSTAVTLPSNSIAQTNVTNGYCDLSSAQTIAGVKTFSSAPVMSGASISSQSIQDSSLSGNVVLKGNATTFTANNTMNGTLTINNSATIGAQEMTGTNIIRGNTTIGTNSTTDVTQHFGKHTFQSSTVGDVLFNGLQCNGYTTFSNHLPTCTLNPSGSYELVNKNYVDNAIAGSISNPYYWCWNFGTNKSGSTITPTNLMTPNNQKSVFLILPDSPTTYTFTVQLNYTLLSSGANLITNNGNNLYIQSSLNFFWNGDSSVKNFAILNAFGSTTYGTSLKYNTIDYVPFLITKGMGLTKYYILFTVGLPSQSNGSGAQYISDFSASIQLINAPNTTSTIFSPQITGIPYLASSPV